MDKTVGFSHLSLSVALLAIAFVAVSRTLLETWARNDTVWAAVAAMLLIVANAVVLPISGSGFALCVVGLLLPFLWWTPFITQKKAVAKVKERMMHDKPKIRDIKLEFDVLDGWDYRMTLRAIDDYRTITASATVNMKCGNIRRIEYRLLPSGVLY